MTSTCASFTQVMTDKFQFDSQELTKMKCEDWKICITAHKSQEQQFEAAKVLWGKGHSFQNAYFVFPSHAKDLWTPKDLTIFLRSKILFYVRSQGIMTYHKWQPTYSLSQNGCGLFKKWMCSTYHILKYRCCRMWWKPNAHSTTDFILIHFFRVGDNGISKS